MRQFTLANQSALAVLPLVILHRAKEDYNDAWNKPTVLPKMMIPERYRKRGCSLQDHGGSWPQDTHQLRRGGR